MLQDPNEDLGLGFPYDTYLGEVRPKRAQEAWFGWTKNSHPLNSKIDGWKPCKFYKGKFTQEGSRVHFGTLVRLVFRSEDLCGMVEM